VASEYKYVAISPDGVKSSGIVEAEDISSAKSIVDARGLIPISVRRRSAYLDNLSLMTSKSIESNKLIFFTRKLHTLSRAGIPILRILDIIIEEAPNDRFGLVLTEVRRSIEGGEGLADSMRKHDGFFPTLFIEAIAAGEESGTLDIMLARSIDLLEREATIKENIKTAVRYPAFVLIAMSVAFFIVITLVIPKFSSLYSSYGASLPWATRLLIDINSFIRTYWIFLIIVIPGLVMVFWRARLTDWGKRGYDLIVLSLPVISPIFLKAIMSRFCHILSTLLSAGLPLSRALGILQSSIDNYYFSKVIVKMGENLSGGRSLLQPMRESRYFSPLVVQMFSIGLESGSLETLLTDVAVHFDSEIEYETRKLTSRIEPILTVVIAVLVLILALAIFTPMWNMIEVFKR